MLYLVCYLKNGVIDLKPFKTCQECLNMKNKLLEKKKDQIKGFRIIKSSTSKIHLPVDPQEEVK